MMPTEGRSVLDSLTAEVFATSADKKAAARKLTPVAGEYDHVQPIPNDTGVFMSNEALHDHAIALRKFAADAIAIADGLDDLVAQPSTPQVKEEKVPPRFRGVDPEPEQTTTFAEDYKEQQKAAQAAVFSVVVDPGVEENPLGWVCPDHNSATLKTSETTKRQYVGCPSCNKFKR